MYSHNHDKAISAVRPQQPENKNPVVARKMTMPAGTRMGLNTTNAGVAIMRAITVPVKVNPDKISRVVPMEAAVKNLMAWREKGAES